MEQLEFLFEKKIKKLPYIERKIKLSDNKNYIITGVKFCGKSFLIKDYIYRSNKNYLYIDLNDFRIDLNSLQQNLQKFINDNNIKLVVLENLKDKNFKIPKAEQIIISSQENIDINGFEKIKLNLLDFEEYIAFDRATDIKTVFNNFLKNGTFPEISNILEYKKEERFFEILHLTFSNDELMIFKELSQFQGHKTSAYHIFTKLKSKMKISKDRFYEKFENLQNRYFYLIQKYKHPAAAKKIYLYDFAIKNYLSLSKEFPKIFENMVFLELYKKIEDIFYYDQIDFYIPSKNEAIFSIPFGNEVTIEKKVIKAYKYLKELDVQKIKVVSVTNSFSFYEKDIKVDVVPFYEWALSEFE
ncbi:AAA family ATPase [Nitrosophilus kaiyonis]|uniref:AAA family ATPase n=1 Tax=Nitrosophilus kaiyonis TaxID=2930200 RepID=UPI00249382EB|nr:AAA family ATPase [Nitrosophilus kaiyonis]